MNLTLVAFYGDKPAPLGALIDKVQRQLVGLLGHAFVPYEPRQVHATIVGLEGWRTPDGLCNSNFRLLRNERRMMDLPRLMTLLDDNNDLLPFTVRFGGFDSSVSYSFTSRGQHPHTRSFAIAGSSVVIMGWPAQANTFTLALSRLRHGLESANVLHKYHASGNDSDNDLFLVLGRLDPANVEPRFLEEVHFGLRTFLALAEPVSVVLRRECLAVVAYADPSLPIQGSHTFSIDEMVSSLSDISSLYGKNEPSA